jgi:hypothetical protein
MRDLYWKVGASRGGEPYRIVAEGTPMGSGSGLPGELMEAFTRFLNETNMTAGTWTRQIGDTKYQVRCSPTARAPQI